MDQDSRRAGLRRAGIALAVVVGLAALALASAHGGDALPSASANDVSLAREAPAQLAAGAQARNPFPQPITQTMTDTVRSMLEEYNRVAFAGLPRPLAVPDSSTVAYLPAIYASNAPEPTPTPGPAPADIAVTIWPDPSIRVARDTRIAYEIRVKNYGEGVADSARITLPYSHGQMVVVGSLFEQEGDWVSAVTDSSVEVTFGPFDPDEQRTAVIYFRVGAALPDDTVISMRATYHWEDARDDGDWRSNWAPVLIGGFNNSAPWVWVRVEPVSGSTGTIYHFFSDRFIPAEGVYIWLNTPSGVGPLDDVVIADQSGRITYDYTNIGLAPGTYQMVFYGARSNLLGIETFYVQ